MILRKSRMSYLLRPLFFLVLLSLETLTSCMLAQSLLKASSQLRSSPSVSVKIICTNPFLTWYQKWPHLVLITNISNLIHHRIDINGLSIPIICFDDNMTSASIASCPESVWKDRVTLASIIELAFLDKLTYDGYNLLTESIFIYQEIRSGYQFTLEPIRNMSLFYCCRIFLENGSHI